MAFADWFKGSSEEAAKNPSTLGIFIFACVVLAAMFYLSGMSIFTTREPFYNNLHLAGPSKCFSCEASLPPHLKWMGRQTKSFDSERQLAREDPNLANLTHGTKCFSCERPAVVQSTTHPFHSTSDAPAQMCMDAGSGQCLF